MIIMQTYINIIRNSSTAYNLEIYNFKYNLVYVWIYILSMFDV